ncbi:MAG TPA: DNA polymerase III subunit beta [Bacteroidota bacterium]|nr:DNA polymerase III subunit beta [Bacteroidota bacterium]
MKFSAPSNELQKVLGLVASVVPSKSTLPILENFLFEISRSTLTITATDLDTSISTSISVKNVSEGVIAVPAKRFSETVRSLPNTDIEFSADVANNKIVMKTGTGEYKLTGESSENFPTLPTFEGTSSLKMDGKIFRRLIEKTSFAVSSDELRPAMTGILFQMKKKEIRTVATDGHRLVKFINTSFSSPGEREVIIPAKAVNIVAKSVTDDDLSMMFDDHHVKFTLGGTTIVSRLVDEKYPNYESVIPTDNAKNATVDKQLLLSSVRRAALYASSTNHQVRFSLKKGSMTVSAEDIDFGSEARETIPCDYSSEQMEIGFNSTYVTDILSHIDTDEVTFQLSSATRAAIVSPVTQRDGEQLLMLIMPVRLNS